MLEINPVDSGRLFVYILCIYSESLLLIGALLPHPGPCGARHQRPLLPHSGLVGSIRPLQSVWALQRSTCSRWRCRAPGEAMVVELLLPVWHLTTALAAAKCLDALRDSRDPRIPLREWWWWMVPHPQQELWCKSKQCSLIRFQRFLKGCGKAFSLHYATN